MRKILIEGYLEINKNILDGNNLIKIQELKNPFLSEILNEYISICKPAKVTVLSDSKDDMELLRELAIRSMEETPLDTKGHTIHFDGYYDQARDKTNTAVLLPKGTELGKYINTVDRDDGLEEVMVLLNGIMREKEMFICFFSLGPTNSRFSLPALQITDSAYVAHSETILYRRGYEEFKKLNGSNNFFHFVHSSGELNENKNSKNIDKRRIYMDLLEERVFSVNTQYAGNSVGLKKLALRLAINRANREDWLCEHMFVMGAIPLDKDRTTYFTGAFPSACGKTSTAMIPGQMILGDDIAYIRKGEDGIAYAVNVEQGIFGIIQDVNSVDDPLIYQALTTPRELIYSNVLLKDNTPYWLGMGDDIPGEGFNYSGEWSKNDKDPEGNEIFAAHKNARYTIRIQELENSDPKLHEPDGVPISGIIYGGRDSDTNPPVLQSLGWEHGVFMGAALESETTAATLGKEGVRKQNPMANLDFLVVQLGTYIDNHLKFGESLSLKPLIFSTNYFLKENGEFLNEKTDKKVWLMWMEGRVHKEFDAIKTPIGYIPHFADLKNLFADLFDKELAEDLYERLFSIRLDKLLDRISRIESFYAGELNLPNAFTEEVKSQKRRLLRAENEFARDIVSPFEFNS